MSDNKSDSDDSLSFEQQRANVRERRKRTASVAALNRDESDGDDGKPEGSDSDKEEPETTDKTDDVHVDNESEASFKPPVAIRRSTTARKGSKKKRRIGKTSRVKTTRKHLFHLLNDNQKAALAQRPNDFNLYGTVQSGTQKSHYNVKFDFFPMEIKKYHLFITKFWR